MLASFRTLARQKPVLRPFSVASFSSSSFTKQDENPEKKEALDDLNELGLSIHRDAQSNSAKSTHVAPSSDSPWRTFSRNTFIRPDRLSFESVSKKRAPPSSRPAVGPSKREARKTDPFYLMNVDPLSQAMNPAMLIPFLSEMGKIYGRNVTALTKKNQRRVGKAIRRARMMGILPILHNTNIFSGSPVRRH